ncbi:MAG: hypothetical protein ACR2QC_11020 [Gammaproteobacteria bacterium]
MTASAFHRRHYITSPPPKVHPRRHSGESLSSRTRGPESPFAARRIRRLRFAQRRFRLSPEWRVLFSEIC